MGPVGQVGRVGVAIALAMATRLAAQAPAAAAAPVFTVVSIKPNTSGTNRSNLDLRPGGRFVAINVTLLQLVRVAYGDDDGPLTRDRLVVSDEWPQRRLAVAAQYDIQAIAERELTQKDLEAALRRLLEDRFALVMHHETKELRGYDLVLARADGTLGPRLRRASIDCSQPQPVQPDGRSGCGFQNFPGQTRGRVLIADLARRVLENALADGRPVADKTGLDGTFEFELDWTPDQTAAPRRPDAPPAPPVDPNGPSFVTALRDQLGLRLEPRAQRIDVVVVDRAGQPSPD